MNNNTTSELKLTSHAIATRLEQLADPWALWLMEYDERNDRRIQNRKFPIALAVWSIILLVTIGIFWRLEYNLFETRRFVFILLCGLVMCSWNRINSHWEKFPTQKHIQRETERDDLYQDAFKTLARIAQFKHAVENGPRVYNGDAAAKMQMILDKLEQLLASRLLARINERRMLVALSEAELTPNDADALQRYLDLVDIQFAPTRHAMQRTETETPHVAQDIDPNDSSGNETQEGTNTDPQPTVH